MGELLSIGAAFIWAFVIILLKKSGEHFSPFSLNLFRVTLSIPAFMLTILLSHIPFPSSLNPYSLGVIALSGVVGIAISDTLFHKALNLCGASITGIIDCIYAPFVAIFAFFILGEHISAQHLAGMVLIIFAILLISIQKKSTAEKPTSIRNIVLGVILGILAMLSVAFAVVIVKPVLATADVIWVTMLRQLFAFMALFIVAIASRHRFSFVRLFIPNKHWIFSVPATFLGSYIALIMWLAGMKYTNAGIAAVLNQTSSIFVIFLAALFLHEKLTRKKLIATAIAFAGILLVTSKVNF